MFKSTPSFLATLLLASSAFAQVPPTTNHAPGAPAMDMNSKHDMDAKPPMPGAGGGPGKVWVNKTSKVYHCQNDKYYGKTKHGEYMNEADAKSKGFHVSGGKACA